MTCRQINVATPSELIPTMRRTAKVTLCAAGRRAFAVADAAPRAMARLLDLLGQLIELGVERSVLDDGAEELRRSLQRPWDRWLDREARTPGPRRAVSHRAGRPRLPRTKGTR